MKIRNFAEPIFKKLGWIARRSTRKLSTGTAILAGGLFFGGSTHAAIVFSEDFESLTPNLGPFVSSSESGGDGTDWTDTLPAGWRRDNTTTPADGPVEFRGWNAFDKNSWVATAGDQQRSLFTRGTGVVMVADPDEYDDLGDIDPNLFNVFLESPDISLAGFVADTVSLDFDSSFRPYDGMIATVDVSFNGGSTWNNILEYTTANSGGDSALGRVDAAVSLTGFNSAGNESFRFRFGNTNAGNDWWWAIDNVVVNATAIPEPGTAGLLGLGLLGLATTRRRKSAV